MDRKAYVEFIRSQALALRAADQPPATKADWEKRRDRLRQDLLRAIGPIPEAPCPLQPRELGWVQGEGFRVQNLLFQTRPDVWVTANAYVPDPFKGKLPAVLVVHGHWRMARRDPVVQARCIGLARLGFFVLAVDAFGAGERYPQPGPGTYHGSLMGASLWPTGHSLLGMQVYDNRRAVDYLVTRPEVDPDKLGITGASGGGNQTMYAGALDERLKAVVPVCSVGNYQAYLHAACCVCEVVPSALRFTEEGDVLGLVAPRALLIISATKDGFQFSVGEAKKSLARAQAIYAHFGAGDRVGQAVFESPHAYNQAMRETMYGWMTRWLKGEGTGQPIPEPKHTVFDPPDKISCFPAGEIEKLRPAGFLFPHTFAAREAKRMLTPLEQMKFPHAEAWDAQAQLMREKLQQILGGLPKPSTLASKLGEPEPLGDLHERRSLQLTVEPGLVLPGEWITPRKPAKSLPACVVVSLKGLAEARNHPLTVALQRQGAGVLLLELRGTGTLQHERDTVGPAPDHTSAEYGVWIGRPLLGQWVRDLVAALEWLGAQPNVDRQRLSLAGLHQAGIIAACAGALETERVAAVAILDSPLSLIPDATGYPNGFRMGLLAPGLFRAGDVPQLLALLAPRPIMVSGGQSANFQDLDAEPATRDALLTFPRQIYQAHKAGDRLLVGKLPPTTVAEKLFHAKG